MEINCGITAIWHGTSKSHSLENQKCKDLAAGQFAVPNNTHIPPTEGVFV